jgi:glycosyltransferase involved in cell wall biosynthesis
VRTLEAFQSIWAPSTHVALALRASGVRTPIHFVPPPVAVRRVPAKTAWSAREAFRFLSIGEAHFRKGFHLLIDGFLQAFPDEGEATLTLKVSPSCSWRSPRSDIRIVADRIERGRLLSLYASHDAYVTASLGEGLGLPLAEAIVAGLPVVANHWGGHRDLMRREHGWTIGHEVVPQVFCSDPAYYAKGQSCAYSSPERIAEALREAVAAAPAERESRARRAAAALQASHGLLPVGSIVLDRYSALVSDGLDVVAHALTR